MEEDYGGGLPDLRHLIASTTPFYKTVQFHEPFPLHRNLPQPPAGSHCFLHQLPVEAADELCPAGGGLLVDHHHHSHTSMFSAVKLEEHRWRNIDDNNFGNCAINDGVGGNNNVINSRWPRQETLTLLEVRSSLDSKFKQTNQKGPLWDEVSRIMAEEHGFQRSGKKCKEKFENLYKYYKKTREGKAGRHDGKNYRFFRQLEAIYGDPQTRNQSSTYDRDLYQNAQNQEVIQDRKPITAESLSFSSNSADEFEQTMSSETNGDDKQSCARPAVKKSWKAKVEEFVSFQMGKVVETQEAWMENMVKSIENREEERTAREEEWRKQEAARFEQQVHEFWAKERAWVEARDAAVMDALNQFTNGNRL